MTHPTSTFDIRRRRKRGVALLLVLVAVAIAATLALSFLSAQSTSLGIARNIQNHSRARYIAESGMELAIAYIRSSDTWRDDQPNNQPNDDKWVNNEPFPPESTECMFTIVGEDGEDTDGDGNIEYPAEGDRDLADDSTDPVTLTVTGKVNGASHVVRVVLAPQSQGNAPHFAVSDKIEVKNDGIIDSYDSTVGPYGGANVSSNAFIATNSTSNDKIKIKDNGVVKGNVQVGPGGDPATVIKLEGSGTITGSTSALGTAVSIPSVSEPSGMGSSQGDVTISSGTTTWSSDQHFDELEVKNSAIIKISGNVTIFSEDEVKFKDNAQLKILPGSQLTLYVTKEVKFEDQALGNDNTADPSVFTIYLLDDEKVEIKESAVLHATVIGPDAELKVKDTGQFYGAFHGKEVKVEDSGQLHSDLSSTLAGGGGGGGSGYTYKVAWQEQP